MNLCSIGLHKWKTITRMNLFLTGDLFEECKRCNKARVWTTYCGIPEFSRSLRRSEALKHIKTIKKMIKTPLKEYKKETSGDKKEYEKWKSYLQEILSFFERHI